MNFLSAKVLYCVEKVSVGKVKDVVNVLLKVLSVIVLLMSVFSS